VNTLLACLTDEPGGGRGRVVASIAPFAASAEPVVIGSSSRPGIEVAALGSGVRALAGSAAAAASGLADRWLTRGDAFLDGLPPDLAVVVVDHEQRALVAGTTGGPHRLFAADDGRGTVRVASHVTDVAAGADGAVRIDRGYEDFLLAHGFLPEGRSPYAGARALAAATVVRWPGATARTVATAGAPPPAASPAPATDRLLDLLTQAVAEQAGGDTEHAVLLGGLDSALVVALLRRLGHRVHAFTFGFGDPRFDQENVDLVVDSLGCSHTWVRITPEVIADGLRTFASVYNQPVPQPHYLLHTLHATQAAAAAGFDHVFTGDGCDAAFLGFPTVNRRAHSVALARRLPAPLIRGVLRATDARAFERHLGQSWRMARGVLEDLLQPAAARGHLPFAILGDVSRDRLRCGVAAPTAEPVADVRLRLAEPVHDLDPPRRAFHGHALTGQSATKVEGAVAATGCAMASPYLHSSVRSFAMALPTDVLRLPGSAAGAPGKDLLVRMVLEHDLLPEAVVLQPKQSPSTSPVDEWYAGPLRPVLLELLDHLPFEWDRTYVEEILRPKLAEDLYRRHVSIDRYAFRAIGLLATYASFTARACEPSVLGS
jgi:asparagine synthetase B (glutamine-hydrolysing)